MCRMMGLVGGAPSRATLEDFRGLAARGNVLPDCTCGHGDGWGFAAYNRGALSFFQKSPLSAADDERYGLAVDQVVDTILDIFIGHVRKASVGDLTMRNAHPFQHDRYVFCHNGGIRNSQDLPVGDLTPEGETDSERYFLNAMSRLESGEARTMKEALAQTVHYIHEHHKYSSICCLISDGESLICYRDYRRAHKPDENLPSDWDAYPTYYTLYFSEKALAFASQPLPHLADDWVLMENGQLIEITPSGTITCDRLKTPE